MQIISTVKVHPACIVCYPTYINDENRQFERLRASLKNVDNYHRNRLSLAATKKIKLAIQYLICQSKGSEAVNFKTGQVFKFKTALITLTLSAHQRHSDAVIKKELINHFITHMRRKWGVTNYIWKAERQENTNVHFHFLVDKYIPFWQLRDDWNRIQEKLGYITEFKKVHGHSKPNSTDIHSTKKVRNLAAYVCKYMTKHQGSKKVTCKRSDAPINSIQSFRECRVSSGVLPYLRKQAHVGRLWAASESLSDLKGGTEFIDYELNEELERLRKEKKCKVHNCDYACLFLCAIKDLNRKLYPRLAQLLDDYIEQTFHTPI